MTTPIILDTDIGTDVDDAFALVMAVKEPEINLLGVTTVYGDVDLRARMARKILDQLGQQQIPVAAGSGQPLFDGKHMYWGGWEGKGLLSSDDSNLEYDSRSTNELIKELLNDSQEKVTLVGIGPLTNLAIFIQDYPDYLDKINEIICMAGSLAKNDEEWNAQCDPEAAYIVFTSGLPIKLGTRHFVNQPVLKQKDLRLLESKGDSTIQILVSLFDEFLSHKSRTHSPMYDPITLSTVFTNQFLPTVKRPLSIQLKNNIIQIEVQQIKSDDAYDIAVPESVDPENFITYLIELLLT